eukprot:4848912-Pleurochrysis_carterae.AAC.1
MIFDLGALGCGPSDVVFRECLLAGFGIRGRCGGCVGAASAAPIEPADWVRPRNEQCGGFARAERVCPEAAAKVLPLRRRWCGFGFDGWRCGLSRGSGVSMRGLFRDGIAIRLARASDALWQP